MISTGDEFADRHDLSVGNPAKQRDAVNYERVDEPFRRRVFARLVKFRTTGDALSVNDMEFMKSTSRPASACSTGGAGGPGDEPVVVANFSEFATDTSMPAAEDVVPNWPIRPPAGGGRDISQGGGRGRVDRA
jgi:pullulanase